MQLGWINPLVSAATACSGKMIFCAQQQMWKYYINEENNLQQAYVNT